MTEDMTEDMAEGMAKGMAAEAAPVTRPGAGFGRVLLGLLIGCHLGPALVVTGAVTAAAAALGWGWPGVGLALLAVATGQVSVGWANDARDAGRDRAAGRTEKPVVRGWVTSTTLWRAAAVAAVLCVPLSFLAAGPIGGTAHVVAVALAWSYDLWLKATVWSFVPYMISFGLVAPFLTYGLTPPQAPSPWAAAALALLGLGAHLANGIPDIEGDRDAGAEGLVARLGSRNSAVGSAAALLSATALLVSRAGFGAAVATSVMLVLAGAAVTGIVYRGGRHLFAVALGLGLLDALLLFWAGSAVLLA